MKTSMRIAAFAVALAVSAPAFSQSAAQLQAETFVLTAIKGDTTEIMLGQMAEQKASSPAVRDLAKTIVQDYEKSRDKAMALAHAMGVSRPVNPTAEGKSKASDLAKLTGSAFDKQYVADMIAMHERTVTEFQSEARVGDKASGFAAQALPTLQKHLAMAENIQRAMH